MNKMNTDTVVAAGLIVGLLAAIFIKMCRKTPSLQGWGYKARPPNLRK